MPIRQFSALALLVFCGPVLAQDETVLEEEEPLERFEVEIVVFAYRDVFASGELLNPPLPPLEEPAEGGPLEALEGLDDPVAPATAAAPPPPTAAEDGEIMDEDVEEAPVIRVETLLGEQLQLEDVRERIDRVDAYELLLHAGFSQEGVEEKWAQPLSIRTLLAPAALDGTIRLHRGRFLHVLLDLTLQPEDSFETPFELKQRRRMRSGELHYFDHPAIGVVVTVRPEPEPEPEPELDPGFSEPDAAAPLAGGAPGG